MIPFVHLWQWCRVGTRAYTTRALQRRGMYIGNEESERKFARWPYGQLTDSFSKL